MKHGSIMSGIGGFDLAARWMGWENLFTCEINSFAQGILKKHFPESQHYGDIKQTNFEKYAGAVDIVSAGVPCQPFSHAGKQLGKSDGRYLWDEYFRCLRECLPQWTVAENVYGLLSTNGGADFENIAGEMESIGYEVFPLLLPSALGQVPHLRQRIWIVGRYFMETDTNTARRLLGGICEQGKAQGTQCSPIVFGNDARFSWFQTISRVHGIRNGVSRKLDTSRNRTLGNAIVPQMAYMIFKAIEQTQWKIYES